MTGFKKRKHSAIVMDATDCEALTSIMDILGSFVCGQGTLGSLTYRPLDEEHPSMLIFEFKANDKRFNDLQNVIDGLFPGLCIYDVAV